MSSTFLLFSTSEINFLDMTIYKNESNDLLTRLYIKPTDTGTLLHYSSYHPTHMFANIIYTQALRYRLLTTDNTILKQQLKKLELKLLSRGYPIKLIKTQLSKIKNITQKKPKIVTLKYHIKEVKPIKKRTSALSPQ